ncbi:Solute carrier family 13 member 5 [Lamellibrachia satsuma]|nr:Solute carrier family 13 member 5 [Lamellibrachia satsuma]
MVSGVRKLWEVSSSTFGWRLGTLALWDMVKPARCAYAIIIIAVYWMTEALPMAATALIPIVAMPWLGVAPSKVMCRQYMKDSNFLFIGGLIVAVAIEKWNLHRRIALRVLITVGGTPKWLMLGFMSVTAFLSMWISNTATTAMLIPIVHAVLLKLEEIMNTRIGLIMNEEGKIIGLVKTKENCDEDGNAVEETCLTDGANANDALDDDVAINEEDIIKTLPPEAQADLASYRAMGKALRLSVCIASNIGGTATLTGTGPNIVAQGQLDDRYPKGHPVAFGTWAMACFPNMIVMLIIAWVYLMIFFMGIREVFKRGKKTEATEAASAVIRQEYKNLGSISFAEVMVSIHFILLGILWLTRDPRFVPGWASLYGEEKKRYVTDASAAITICVFLFICPSRRPNFFCFRKADDTSDPTPAPPILDWKTVQKKLAWDVIIILGGGFALAEACQVSGLSDEIGKFLSTFGTLPRPIIVLLVSTVTVTVTQITSNISTTTIFLPIVASLGERIGVNPLYFIIPVTLSASYAYVLPVSTPPNAIVLAFGRLELKDMMFSGVGLAAICMLVTQVAINTWAIPIFDLGTYPDWAPPFNNTN